MDGFIGRAAGGRARGDSARARDGTSRSSGVKSARFGVDRRTRFLPARSVDSRESATDAWGDSPARIMSADARARDLERALAEAWPSHRCAAALDDALVDALKSRFGIMTPFARRGALYAAVLAAKRSGGDAAYAAELASAAREDTDEWARFTALAMDENFERFDVERVETSVPAVRARTRRETRQFERAKAPGR